MSNLKGGKWFGAAAILLALVLVGAVGWRLWETRPEEESAGASRDRGAVAVETAPVDQGLIRDLRVFTGTLEAASRFSVAPKVSGRLLRLEVDIGDAVSRGQEVGRLDDDEFVQQLAQAEAELEIANANVAEAASARLVAQRDYERVRALRQRDIASESDLDAAEAQLRAAEARVKVAEATVLQRRAALETARLRLSHTRVTADWTGGGEIRLVGERFADEGGTLSANEPLFSLLDIDTVRAVIFVTERDYGRLRIGQRAALRTNAVPGRSFEASVARIAPQFRENVRQARVELSLENQDRLLKPGMFARLEIELGREEDALVVPIDSLVRRNGVTGLFWVDREESRARFSEVETGIRDRSRIQILQPVITGEVITLGQDQLVDGAAVRVVADEATTPVAAREGRNR